MKESKSHLKDEAGDVYDHSRGDPVERDARAKQANSPVHRLNHCKRARGEYTGRERLGVRCEYQANAGQAPLQGRGRRQGNGYLVN